MDDTELAFEPLDYILRRRNLSNLHLQVSSNVRASRVGELRGRNIYPTKAEASRIAEALGLEVYELWDPTQLVGDGE